MLQYCALSEGTPHQVIGLTTIVGTGKYACSVCFEKLPDVSKARIYISMVSELLGICTKRFDLTRIDGLKEAYKCLVVKMKKTVKKLEKRVRETLDELFADMAKLFGYVPG